MLDAPKRGCWRGSVGGDADTHGLHCTSADGDAYCGNSPDANASASCDCDCCLGRLAHTNVCTSGGACSDRYADSCPDANADVGSDRDSLPSSHANASADCDSRGRAPDQWW